MPLRKKVGIRILTGVGENHRSEPSADHIYMHSEGAGSSSGTAHREIREMMATIEDLQCSQAAMPPYPEEIVGKPYPANYIPSIFPKYDGITGNAREHIRRYVNALTAHDHDHELRLRKFSKSLEGRAFTWLEVTMTFFIGHEDPMAEEVENMASSSSALPSLLDEEMIVRIQQEDKIHSFLKGIGLRLMARREATQALTRVMERNHEVVAIEVSLMQVAYQEANDSITFSNKDLVNRAIDSDRPLYVIAFVGASRIKRALVDIGASTNILPLLTFDALGILRERIIPEPMQVAGVGAL
nr:hypothetical protein CFP56_55263 [Quercus suber]